MAAAWPIPQALVMILLSAAVGLDPCPSACVCPETPDGTKLLDCSRKALSDPPVEIPAWVSHV